MISAYEGDLPYIFVSYAHKNSREVFDLIEKLAARGYRIWYDEGIEPGSEWPENIAEHLLRADMVLAMITNESMDSINCRREINYAMSKNKPFLSVVLEKTDIPAGMELQLSSQQSVLKYNFDNEQRFLDKIESCSYMDPCKIEVPDMSNPSKESDSTYIGNVQNNRSSKKRPDIRIAIGLGAVLAALIIFFVVIKKPYDNGSPNDNVSNVQAIESTVSDVSKAENVVDVSTGTDSIPVMTEGNDSEPDVSGTESEPDVSTDSDGEPAGSADNELLWAYSVSEDDTNLTYTFERGPVIVMPASWSYRLTVMEKNNYFVFYHAASKYSWHLEGIENGGVLFSLGFDPTTDYKDLPSYSELGRSADGYYFLTYPTDVQGYMNNERTYNEYMDMAADITYVKQHSSFSKQ